MASTNGSSRDVLLAAIEEMSKNAADGRKRTAILEFLTRFPGFNFAIGAPESMFAPAINCFADLLVLLEETTAATMVEHPELAEKAQELLQMLQIYQFNHSNWLRKVQVRLMEEIYEERRKRQARNQAQQCLDALEAVIRFTLTSLKSANDLVNNLRNQLDAARREWQEARNNLQQLHNRETRNIGYPDV